MISHFTTRQSLISATSRMGTTQRRAFAVVPVTLALALSGCSSGDPSDGRSQDAGSETSACADARTEASASAEALDITSVRATLEAAVAACVGAEPTEQQVELTEAIKARLDESVRACADAEADVRKAVEVEDSATAEASIETVLDTCIQGRSDAKSSGYDEAYTNALAMVQAEAKIDADPNVDAPQAPTPEGPDGDASPPAVPDVEASPPAVPDAEADVDAPVKP